MKVIALFQFYFPYVLPRAPDWRPVRFKHADWVVVVRPREPHEDLFPEAIDKTLATMQIDLSRISAPRSAVKFAVRDRCHDRIEVRVEAQVSSSEDVQLKDTQDAFLDVAIGACNTFLGHCRAVGRVAFLTGVERHFRLEDSEAYMLTPYSVSWFDGQSGRGLPAYPGEVNAFATSGAIESPERGAVSMALILQSLGVDEQPSLTASLLVSAESALRSQHLREATIDMATACEVASDNYLEEVPGGVAKQAAEILKRNTSFADKRFHLLPRRINNRSLKTDDSATFELIEKMYRTRNSLSHKGRLRYRDGASWIEVDQRQAAEFLRASWVAFEWIQAL